MPIIKKLLSPVVGLAAEAIAHQKEKSRAKHEIVNDQEEAVPSSSTAHPVRARDVAVASSSSTAHDAPPAYTVTAVDGTTLAEGAPAQEKAQEVHSDAESSDENDHDEDDWDLDDAAEDADPPSYDQMLDNEDIPALTRSVLRTAKPPTGAKLPLPVIIPQRRPRNKARGFVRAYAPVLEDVGIDQDTFLRFQKAFHSSSQPSKTWDVIMISAAIAGFAPGAIALAVTTVVQVAAGTAKEIQSRKRTNNFLDEMNLKLFMPRGLIAMIMTFKPDVVNTGRSGPISGIIGAVGSLVTHKELDMNQSIAKYYVNDGVTGVKKTMQGLRLSSGKTKGELAMPEAAPLVYPSLEEVAQAIAAGHEGEEVKKKESALHRSGKCMSSLLS
jgi:hypothetical protein